MPIPRFFDPGLELGNRLLARHAMAPAPRRRHSSKPWLERGDAALHGLGINDLSPRRHPGCPAALQPSHGGASRMSSGSMPNCLRSAVNQAFQREMPLGRPPTRDRKPAAGRLVYASRPLIADIGAGIQVQTRLGRATQHTGA